MYEPTFRFTNTKMSNEGSEEPYELVKELASIVPDHLEIPMEEVAEKTRSSLRDGLSLKQVDENRSEFGVNRLPERASVTFW